MAFNEARARYLRDRVMTATPAQRIVMMYDRLSLDLTQAATAEDPAAAGTHLGHAMTIVAELQGSLDSTGGPAAQNLSSLYAYLLRELVAIRGGDLSKLPPVSEIVSNLRATWAQAAEQVSQPVAAAASGSWVS